jgi:hypothetical protein
VDRRNPFLYRTVPRHHGALLSSLKQEQPGASDVYVLDRVERMVPLQGKVDIHF